MATELGSNAKMYSPLSQGQRIEQMYRWARLFGNWVVAIQRSDYYLPSAQSNVTARASQHAMLLSVKPDTDDGEAVNITYQVRDALGSALAEERVIYAWASSVKGGRAFDGWPSVVPSKGSVFLPATSVRTVMVRTSTDGQAVLQWRFPNDTATVYAHGMVHRGKSWWDSTKFYYSN